MSIIKTVSTKGISTNCKLDISSLKHCRSMLKQLTLMQTMAQSISLSRGIELFKPSLLGRWAVNGRIPFAVSLSKVPAAKYISHLTPVEASNIEQQVRQQEWNSRQDAKMRLADVLREAAS
ncbi:MAG: hypothetical protein U5O16_00185 [Rhodococcus sp. (in: high G+C Gram-positive bacteria)]|uniref:hypothetical protein n=1 Tax=Rhodococcus sp. TaxID=1831 RepID=UPI002AD8AF79|nr:hypothetical protein [Rhodococcus sp. (in: high G+C Gram-positive bacteria)]